MVKLKLSIILVTILFLSLINFVSAVGCANEGYLGRGALNENFTVVISCPTCSFINFTLTSPSRNIIINNTPMVQNGNNFVFTIPAENLTEIGFYKGDGGDDVSPLGFCFDITKNGYEISTAESILYVLLFIVTMLFFVFFTTMAIMVPFSNETATSKDIIFVTKVTGHKYLKIMSAWFAYASFLFLLMFLTGFTQNYINFPEMKTLITTIFTFSYYLGFGISTLIIWLLFILLWKDILFNKTIRIEGKAILKEIQS